jgi:protein SCO1/2
MKRKRIFYILVTVLCLIAIGWGVILYQVFMIKSKADYYGNSYEREAPAFTLTDHNGSRVELSDFKGKAVLLFFGYTHCPDICPVTMGTLNSVTNTLGEDKDKVQVLFITIDPERDDQEKLKNYVPFFNESFIGLTGTPEEIDKVADDYNAFYEKEDMGSETGYLMGHASSVYLINPKGKLVLRYPQNRMDPEGIAGDIRQIL